MSAEEILSEYEIEDCLLARLIRGELNPSASSGMAIVDAQTKILQRARSADEAYQSQFRLLFALKGHPRYSELSELPCLIPRKPHNPMGAHSELSALAFVELQSLSEFICDIPTAECTSAEFHQGRLIAAIVVLAGQVNKQVLKHLLKALQNNPEYDANGVAYYELWLPAGGRESQEFRRILLPHAVEALLLQMPGDIRRDLSEIADRPVEIHHRLTTFMTAGGQEPPANLAAFLATARHAVAVATSPLLHAYLARQLASHSLSTDAWYAINEFDLPVARQEDSADLSAPEPEQLNESDHRGSEWYREITKTVRRYDPRRSGTGVGSRPAIIRELGSVAARLGSEGIFSGRLMAQFAASLISEGKGKRRIPISPETVNVHLSRVYHYVLDVVSGDPKQLSTIEFEDLYTEAIEAAGSRKRAARVGETIVRLHNYLVAEHSAPEVDLSTIRWLYGGLSNVDGWVITERSYRNALRLLDSMRAEVTHPAIIDICRLILILGYRLGARRRELWGLRVCDVHDGYGATIHIFPNESRRLKSPNSQRRIDIHSLLLPEEYDELLAWVTRRRMANGHLAMLFQVKGLSDRDTDERRIYDLIHDALRESSGIRHVHFHLLRHTAATRLMAVLMLDADSISRSWLASLMPAEWNSEAFANIRWRLTGSSLASRKAAYALCRLLGHGSPKTTLEHYVHGLETLVYERLLWAYPVDAVRLAQLGGLSKTQAYEAAALGQAEVMRRLRRRAGIKPTAPSKHRHRDSADVDILPVIRRALLLHDRLGATPDEISRILPLDSMSVDGLIGAAKALYEARRTPMRGRRLAVTADDASDMQQDDDDGLVPDMPGHRVCQRHASAVFAALVAWAQREPDRVRRFVQIFAHRMRPSLGAVVFHDVTADTEEARFAFEFLKDARPAGIEFELVSYNSDSRSPHVKAWRAALSLPRKIGIAGRTASSRSHESPKRWLGICLKPVQSDEARYTAASVAHALSMMGIYLEAGQPPVLRA